MLRRLPFLLVALSLSAHAGTWRYSLKPGTVSKFHYRGVDDVAVSMPMMPAVSQHLVVETDYAVKVLKALPDGRADVEVKLEKVVLTDGAGTDIQMHEIQAAAVLSHGLIARATMSRGANSSRFIKMRQ